MLLYEKIQNAGERWKYFFRIAIISLKLIDGK